MAALSSTSVVPAIAQSSTFSSRLPSTRSLLFSTTGKERAFLTISKDPSRVYSQRAGFVPLVNATGIKEVDVSKVVPQADRVLIKLEELSEKSIGGVLLPKSAVKFEHYLCGEVLSIGKEAAGVSVGQKVLFSDLNAYEVNFGTTEKLCFCKAGDLLAFVE